MIYFLSNKTYMLVSLVVKNSLSSIKNLDLNTLTIDQINDALLEATRRKYYHIVKYILKNRQYISVICPQYHICIEIILSSNDKKLFNIFTKHHKIKANMIDIVLWSNYEFIKYIFDKLTIDHNITDDDGNNALNHAIIRAKVNIVKFLLKNNYNPNQLNKKNETSFMISVTKNNYPMMMTIYKYSQYKLLTTCKDNFGRSLLHHATLVNNVNMVKFLIGMQINMNYIDSDGRTALIVSVIYDYDKITEIILQTENVDYYLTDKHGKSALQYAINNKNNNMIRLLNFYNIYL